jgi:hypothetical protein
MSWERVQRTMKDMEERQRAARTEDQCIAVGALARDLLISLGQAVYDPAPHGAREAAGVEIGNADAKRMLDAYIDAALPGKPNAEFRAQAKSTVTAATALSHKRTSKAGLINSTATGGGV